MAKPSDPQHSNPLADNKQDARRSHRFALLICFHLIVCVISLRLGFPYYRNDYILYDPSRLHYTIAALAALSLLSPIFVFTRVTFGYFCGFYLFTMTAGYLWLNAFSKFQYDHLIAAISTIVSCAALLVPSLLITSPIGRPGKLSKAAFERLLYAIVLFSLVISVSAATYGFRLVSIADIYKYRAELQFPTPLNYAIIATNSVLLPFAFASYVSRDRYWGAGLVLAVAISFYPSTLSKMTLFAPAWMVFIATLSRFSARATPILSICLPVLGGIILVLLIGEPARRYFNIVNWRMVIIPSQALDVYNEYFARHELTHFCQIWLLKPFVSCALEVPLSVEMQNNYGLGNFNASLFATEGIASVGPWLAPVVVLFCGLVIGFGNRVSAGLSPRFILVSAAIVPQTMMNVPFSTIMLSHGLWLLFLLWYLTPRTLFSELSSTDRK